MPRNRKLAQSEDVLETAQLQPVSAQVPQILGGNGAMLTQGSEDKIRARAYELYEQRGREDGFHEQDWSQAQAEVLAQEAERNSKLAA